jgi:hypothetical protein
MAQVVRAYAGKDEEMLTACSTIADQAFSHKTFLISKRAAWADPFFANLKTTIDTAFTSILGIDNIKARRIATQAVYAIQKNALRDIAEFKVQVASDFSSNKPRLKEILIELGFTAYLKKAQQKDEEALVALLFTFKTNMDAALTTEITAAGTDAALITTIAGYAQTLKNANVTQESFKGSSKELTQTSIIALNAIYNQTIAVAKISRKFYKGNTSVQDLFSYSKTLKKLNISKTPPVAPPPAPPVPPV